MKAKVTLTPIYTITIDGVEIPGCKRIGEKWENMSLYVTPKNERIVIYEDTAPLSTLFGEIFGGKTGEVYGAVMSMTDSLAKRIHRENEDGLAKTNSTEEG